MTTTEQENLTAEVVAEAVAAAVEAARQVGEQQAAEPQVRDPWGVNGAPIQVGRVFSRDEWNALVAARGRLDERKCGQRLAGVPGLGRYGYCDRENHGPEVRHFVVNNLLEVVWTWVNGEELIDVPTVEEVTDPADAKVDKYEVGMRVNKRNSRDVLMVLSVPRKRDERVEILDLTHQRFRKIDRKALVPAREGDPEPTQEQMQWVATFIADRRANAYEIAQREVTNRRWSKDQMLASVKRIGIAESKPRYGFDAAVSIRIQVPNENARLDNLGEIQAAVEAAIKTAGAQTLPEGFTVVAVNNFNVGGVTEIR